SVPAPVPSMARALHAPNEQQRVVIGDTAHSILLLAGAGTGKTDTLARRVANLIVSGAAAPETIRFATRRASVSVFPVPAPASRRMLCAVSPITTRCCSFGA
ncbi:UvrD-helicase domain-containing protein, partial [Pseudomonas syringae pv. tagetis]